MDTIKDQLSFYASSLQLRGKRNNILASNIANAATPNYKARDISFEDEIKKFDKNGPIRTSHENHIVQNSGKSIQEVSYREPLIASLDGNTVEMAVEQMQFAENSMRYTSTVNFLNGKINKIMSAIRGE
ncbi:flagellar basal body rod protein FlgB [Pseudomonadota bacterium]|jgi:flagellar basal-body rod protein FlgB|nr:flagellar basal body rod protein FlgB [Pseudomonadota bacterium]